MLLLAIIVLALLAVGAYAGYKYLGDDEEEPVPFHSSPEKSALPPQQ